MATLSLYINSKIIKYFFGFIIFIFLFLYIKPVFFHSSEDDLQPRYIEYDKNKTQAIVFIHGYHGDSNSTWTNSDNNAYWPELIKTDKIFDKSNIYVYEYASPLIEKALSINQLSEEMDTHFVNDKIFEQHSELIFIVHSMGGLLIRDFLLKYQSLAKQVKFIYFYATPTTGNSIANILKYGSQNPQSENMGLTDKS